MFFQTCPLPYSIFLQCSFCLVTQLETSFLPLRSQSTTDSLIPVYFQHSCVLKKFASTSFRFSIIAGGIRTQPHQNRSSAIYHSNHNFPSDVSSEKVKLQKLSSRNPHQCVASSVAFQQMRLKALVPDILPIERLQRDPQLGGQLLPSQLEVLRGLAFDSRLKR